MADYNAKIKLLVEGLQSLDKVEAKVKEIHRLTAGGWRVDLQSSEGFKKLNRDLDAIANKGKTAAKALQDSFKNVGSIAKGAGIAGVILAVNQFGVALENASAKAGLFGPAVQAVGSSIKTALPGVDALVQAFSALPPALQATAPALAAVTAGLIAFNAPIRTAVSDTLAVVKALNPVKNAIKTAFNTTLLMAFADQLDLNINATENYRKTLLSLTDTIGDLSRRKAALQNVLNNTNSSTDTAVKIAEKLVDVTQRLNNEQREQNDLLRQARGLSQTTLEETKAVKSIQTKRRREEYLSDLAQGVEATLRAAAELDQELINLDKSLADLDTAAAERRWQALEKQWRDADEAAAALAARLDDLRRKEAAESLRARGGKEPIPFDTGGVVRRTIAGPAYAEPAGPGGAGVTRASAVAAEEELRRTLDLQLKKTAATGSWVTALQAGSRWLNEDLGVTAALLKANDGLLSSTNAQIEARRRLVKIKKFEAEQTKKARRTEQLNESIALGVGFPLLFGGGLGSVAGSFAGSFAGKGFGGQIIGGALGQSVEDFIRSAAKVTSSTESISEALGLSGTRSEEYLKSLQEAGKETEAYSFATERLATVVGRDGVQALKNLEEAGKVFNKAFAEISTSILALAAQLISGAAKSISTAVEETALFRKAAVSTDPQIQRLIRQRQSVGAGVQSFLTGGRSDEELIKRILDRQRELDKIQDEKLKKAAQINTISEEELRINRLTVEEKNAQISLAELGNDLTDTRVFLAKQDLIEAKFRVEAEQELLKGTSDVNAQLNRRLALTELNRQREEALAAAAKKADDERIRAYQLQLQLQNQLAQSVLEEYRLFEQGVDLFKGPIAGYEKSLILLERRIALQEGIIKNEYKSVKASKEYAANQAIIDATFDNRLNNLKLEENFLKSQLVIQRERARLEQEISIAQLESQNKQRRVAGQTEIDRLQTELAFPFGGEQLERDMQMLDQYTRRINELVPLQDNLAEIQKTITKAEATPGLLTEDQLNAKRAEFNIQQDQLNQLTAELQIRDQLEQQLLRQQQIYARYGFIADEVSRALSDSIAGLVTGTTTVAEAFGRMFENIGKAFIDMATQILAQQLLIQVVSAFLPSGFGATDSRGFSFGSLVDAFADGGFVTGPTRAIIGEGGEPEYVIPASKMPGALARYASGMRGSGVIDGAISDNRDFLDSLTTGVNGSTVDVSESQDAVAATRASLRETERLRENRMQIMSQQSASERRYERERIEQMASTPGNLNIKYESQVINNVEYVTRDQAERMAAQSALRGRELAINSLQTSVKTRKRVGMA